MQNRLIAPQCITNLQDDYNFIDSDMDDYSPPFVKNRQQNEEIHLIHPQNEPPNIIHILQ